MAAYYNEIDPYAAQWLRNLIAAGHIAPGDVDERSIVDVRPDDLRGYVQCHFFAGIGVWSYALRLAGWPDDEPVWTGSCPCQPFSDAGDKGGLDDERHLWPYYKGLAIEHGANPIFGEQVASADGLAWLDFVCADLEAAGYSVGAVDTCAAGFGAPHIRQRLYFVGHAWREGSQGCLGPRDLELHGTAGPLRPATEAGLLDSSVGDSAGIGQPGRGQRDGSTAESRRREAAIGSELREQAAERLPIGGFWRDAEWLRCLDGKSRPVEPGASPLAHGAPSRVGRLRAYGNAINAEQARWFISAYREITE